MSQDELQLLTATRGLERPSRLRLISYRAVRGFVYFSFFIEAAYAKFAYDIGCQALRETLNVMFKVDVPEETINPIMISLTVISLGADLTCISPKKDAMAMFFLKEENGMLVVEREENEQQFQISRRAKIIDFLGLKVFPCICLFLNFSMNASSYWYPIHPYLKQDKAIDYGVGVTVMASGLTYLLLLSTRDTLDAFAQLRNFPESSVVKLFNLSKIIFFMPASKNFITMLYRGFTTAYLAGWFAEEILGCEDQKLSFELLGFCSSSIITLATRPIPACNRYLEPFKQQRGYNLHAVSNDMIEALYESMKPSEKFFLNLKCSPLAIVRGLGFGYLSYLSLTHYAKGHETLAPMYGVIGAGVGGLFLAHSFYVEKKTEVASLARAYQKKQEEAASATVISRQENEQEKPGATTKVAASITNIVAQTVKGLIAIYSAIQFLEGKLDEDMAASIGLVVALESGWVNRTYLQGKIESRLTDLGKPIKRKINSFFAWYRNSGSDDNLASNAYPGSL